MSLRNGAALTFGGSFESGAPEGTAVDSALQRADDAAPLVGRERHLLVHVCCVSFLVRSGYRHNPLSACPEPECSALFGLPAAPHFACVVPVAAAASAMWPIAFTRRGVSS